LKFFFTKKFIFYQKDRRNLVKSIYNFKNPKEPPQNPKSNINKKSFQGQICFLGGFNVKQHLSEILLIIWNHLIQKSIILVIRIGVNIIFLSLPSKSDNFLFFFKLKTKKMKFWIKINFFINLKNWKDSILIINKKNEN
jgi:hypothetical protein